METAIERHETGLGPRLTQEMIDDATTQERMIDQYVRTNMVRGKHFGVIPGAKSDSLWKKGADKVIRLFRAKPKFELLECQQDWEKEFFSYIIKCSLENSAGEVLAEGLGACNSHESKYRWRDEKRRCPQCGVAAIRRAKRDRGGGWYCWDKEGGCGAQFEAGSANIEDQVVGRVANPDVCDLQNTIVKMAEKRAKVGAASALVNDLLESATEKASPPAEDVRPMLAEATKLLERLGKSRKAIVTTLAAVKTKAEGEALLGRLKAAVAEKEKPADKPKEASAA